MNGSENRSRVSERSGSPSQSLHTASPWATGSNPGSASGRNGATKCAARSSRQVCGRAFERGLACNTQPNLAESDSVLVSAPLSFAEHCVASTSAPDPGSVGLICVWDMRSALLGSIAESCRGESCFSRWFAPFGIPENQIPAWGFPLPTPLAFDFFFLLITFPSAQTYPLPPTRTSAPSDSSNTNAPHVHSANPSRR